MASGDWANVLGAALQQFGSSYKDYSANKYAKEQEAQRIKMALARQEIEDKRYEEQQKRQGVLDERNVLKDFAESAPFEAGVSPEMEQRFKAAGMEGLLGTRPETQTNIPSQFLMEGGAAQTADPGTFLRPSLQQQAAMQQIRANDPAIRRQLQLEEEARGQKQWESRQAVEHRNRLAELAAQAAGALKVAQTREGGPNGVSPSVLAQTKGVYMNNPDLGEAAWKRDFPYGDASMLGQTPTQAETIDALNLLKSGKDPQEVLSAVESNRNLYEAQGIDTNQVIRNVLKALGMAPTAPYTR